MVRRVTTGGLMKSYKSGLQRSYRHLASATEKVTTERNFNSYAENPAKASLAFQLRHDRWNVENQLANSTHVTHKFQQAWDCLNKTYDDLGHKLANYSTIVAFNDPDASGRQALGSTIQGAADAVLHTMNAQYGNRFVFSGADGDTVPFSWQENADGTRSLLYRGIKVDVAAEVPNPDYIDIDWNDQDAVDDYVAAHPGFDPNTYDKNTPPTIPNPDPDYQKLMDTLKETTYVDLGMGMKEDNNGDFISSSGFNTALNGVHFLGGGVDEDGDPENIISLMNEIGNILSRCDEEDGHWATPEDGERCERLWGKMTDGLEELHAKWMEHNVESQFVKTNQTRLESLDDSYNEQVVSIEDIDPAEAITSLMWAQYSYNAALRIGTGLLSQSLIDYMS